MNIFRKQSIKVLNQFNRTVFSSFSMMGENHKDIWMERAKKIGNFTFYLSAERPVIAKIKILI